MAKIANGPWFLDTTTPDTPENQLREAMRREGIEAPPDLYFDGTLHRFNADNKKDKSGWYIIFGDGIPAGKFGCWRSGIETTWRAEGRELTPDEHAAQKRRMEEAKAARDEAVRLRRANATEEVAEIWQRAASASADHPYLTRKGIGPHGARVANNGQLIVPLFDSEGQMTSLQYISHDGKKRYHTGGQTAKCYWHIGSFDEPGPVYIAEGFATAATIHEQTGRFCFVAYSANNLSAVTGYARELLGQSQELVIVADNDKSGTGQNSANEASIEHGARVVLIPNEGQDANDYHQSGEDLRALLSPPTESNWLVSADEWAKEPAPINWLIKGWIEEESLNMVHGASGNGKTFVVLDMCLHLAAGKTHWNGQRINPCTVLYLAGEGHHGLKSRIAAWKYHHGVDHLNMYLSLSGCDLNTPEGLQKVLMNLRTLPDPPKFIVIDTLHRHLKGNENSAEDTKTMLDACDVLRQEKAAVLLVHHTGVNQEEQHRARGSSAWRGALESEISVSAGPMKIEQKKSKNSELLPPVHCELKKVMIPGWFDDEGEPVGSLVLSFCDGPQAEPEEKVSTMTPLQTTGWNAYRYAAGEVGILTSDGKFGGLRDSDWRDYFYKSEEMKDKSQETKKKSYQRMKRDLIDRGFITEMGNIYFRNHIFKKIDSITFSEKLQTLLYTGTTGQAGQFI